MLQRHQIPAPRAWDRGREMKREENIELNEGTVKSECSDSNEQKVHRWGPKRRVRT